MAATVWPGSTVQAQLLSLAAASLMLLGALLLVFARQVDAVGRAHAGLWPDRPMVAVFRLTAVCGIAAGAFGFYLLVRPVPGAPPHCCAEQAPGPRR